MIRTGSEVIVDSNIWIEAFTKGNIQIAARLAQMESEGKRLLIVSVVKMEVLYTSIPAESFKELKTSLDRFELYYPSQHDLEVAIDIMLETRRAGRGMSPIDAIIAACAVNLRLPVCTLDKDFQAFVAKASSYHIRIIDPYQLPTR